MKSAPHLYLQPRHSSPNTGTNRSAHPHSSSSHGGDAKTDYLPRQVVVRLLCNVDTAGGVIGKSGTIIKQLESQTGTKIHFEGPVRNCKERVINIIGDPAVDRKISIDLETLENENEDIIFEVSSVQEALMSVFRRIIEVEANDRRICACRLLGGPRQIGALMGREGKNVNAIRRNSGAKIRLLDEDQIPASAAPDEEVIQITGDVRAVKTALVSVSGCLQNHMLGERLQMFSDLPIQDTHANFLPKENIAQHCYPGNFGDKTSSVTSLSADVDRRLSLHERITERQVVFRLLCSNIIAGGVIGTCAAVVKALEKETGASIKIYGPVPGSKERVATISSPETAAPSSSSAQIATLRVFARSVEVSIDQGIISALHEGETVAARILVAPNEIDCLMNDNGKVASGISATCGVEISLLCAPSCASENDEVVQITGVYDYVTRALYQVTGRLRDKLFYSTVSDESKYKFHPSPSVNQLNHLGVDLKDKEMGEDGLRRPLASGVEIHQSRTIEVLVPENGFCKVYGENGRNLARMKEISGAEIILCDPSPGKCDGKVINHIRDALSYSGSSMPASSLPLNMKIFA